ncbi:MAG: hypothetical protein ABIH71_01805 [Candidatus Omnitrophota bacterium]|nr:hypothetical protein [Candidatus Omnitrophota bacterium]
MNYLKFKKCLAEFTVFSLRDIRNIDPNFYRRRLNEWQDKGYIIKIVKGYYVFSDLEVNENILFSIANKIYNPSYISLEMALAYYRLIPESVYNITSVSTRKTYRFKTKVAEFSFRSISPRLFFGYQIIKYAKGSFNIARAEKALLDYLYLNKHILTKDDFVSLRINREEIFKQIKKNRLYRMAKQFNQKKFFERIKSFWEFVSNA